MAEVTNATVEGQGGANATPNGNQEGQGNDKTYTQAEFDAMLQSETDKRVTEALKTAQSKWESEYQTKLENEKSEAVKLAKMSAEERNKALADREREKYETERAKFERERLEFETVKQLAEKKLPTELAKCLCGTDAESTKANIEAFEKAYGEAIQKAVDERLKGKPPKTGAAKTDIGGSFIDIIRENQRR